MDIILAALAASQNQMAIDASGKGLQHIMVYGRYDGIFSDALSHSKSISKFVEIR
jgi:hypothetical protein